MRVYYLGIVGGVENTAHTFDETQQAELDLLITRLLNVWHNLGYAIERPLFPDAEVKEWIAYDGTRIMRQMTLIREEVDDASTD